MNEEENTLFSKLAKLATLFRALSASSITRILKFLFSSSFTKKAEDYCNR